MMGEVLGFPGEGALEGKRNTEVEEWRDTDVAEGGSTQKAAAIGPRSSEAEGDLFVSEVGVHEKDTEECEESFGQVKAPPQKRRAVKTCRSRRRHNTKCERLR